MAWQTDPLSTVVTIAYRNPNDFEVRWERVDSAQPGARKFGRFTHTANNGDSHSQTKTSIDTKITAEDGLEE